MKVMRSLFPLLLVCAAAAQQPQTPREVSALEPTEAVAIKALATGAADAPFEVTCPQPPADCILHPGESATLLETPEPQRDPPATFWTWGGRNSPRTSDFLRSNRQAFHDKTWLISQGVWLAAISYDVEATHQGIAHHKCVEGGDGANLTPSRGELYRNHIAEYATGTLWNYVWLRILWKPEILQFPAYGSAAHFVAGSKWFTDCW